VECGCSRNIQHRNREGLKSELEAKGKKKRRGPQYILQQGKKEEGKTSTKGKNQQKRPEVKKPWNCVFGIEEQRGDLTNLEMGFKRSIQCATKKKKGKMVRRGGKADPRGRGWEANVDS